MKTSWKESKLLRTAGLGVFVLVFGFMVVQARAGGSDYNSNAFGGSSYVHHGPAPAYGGAYGLYGTADRGIEGRFSADYGEYNAVPGYGRFGAASSYGTGPLRAAGTGVFPGRQWHTPFAGNLGERGFLSPPSHGVSGKRTKH